ncbi:MAG: hydroxymethylglutaryl-CoA reductase, degradative [Acidobacteria bacterium]|nr:hydroxymethylglutaryl-CoA reductase, degradative [Acidobacteriota bacterium]
MRLPKFYNLSVPDRLLLLKDKGILSDADYQLMLSEKQRLTAAEVDRMVENVIGAFTLPIGLGLNFLVNGKEYTIPMVVEEPSIVAAVSSAAKTVSRAGGFRVRSDEPMLTGQIQLVDLPHPERARQAILQNKPEILEQANSLHPRMVERGGGAKDLEVVIHAGSSRRGDMLVVNLLVDTRDAMGANMVNSMCEGVAPLIEKISGGMVFLRILSNLTDRAMVRAEAVIPVHLLKNKRNSCERVRDGIILANEFAETDPYRAATHNKGIMNGIDAVAIATGNDWRAIEAAAAHAYAGRGSSYTSLTRWTQNDEGDLVGSLAIPLKVGTVGGNLRSNKAVQVLQRILNVKSARELAEVMGAVGLAQNFSALRALSTEGIQRGHMSLHARSVAVSAGATPDIFEIVVERLVESAEIKEWKAKEIIRNLEAQGPNGAGLADAGEKMATGFGKVILLGEHAVVYGSHAIAAPLRRGIRARVLEGGTGIRVLIPRWGIEATLFDGIANSHSMYNALEQVIDGLELSKQSFAIEVFPDLPRSMGLGGSAALAVAVVRALSGHFRLGLDDSVVNDWAFHSEKVVHGTPSGIDNTVSTFGKFILYRKPDIRPLHVTTPIPIVVGLTGKSGHTIRMVTAVRKARQKAPEIYDSIFKQINELTLASLPAIETGDMETLGRLMNVAHGLLNSIGVSCWELEELIQIARKNGSPGAKLTGSGGGGAMIALAPEHPEKLAAAMKEAGYQSFITEIGFPSAGASHE